MKKLKGPQVKTAGGTGELSGSRKSGAAGKKRTGQPVSGSGIFAADQIEKSRDCCSSTSGLAANIWYERKQMP